MTICLEKLPQIYFEQESSFENFLEQFQPFFPKILVVVNHTTLRYYSKQGPFPQAIRFDYKQRRKNPYNYYFTDINDDTTYCLFGRRYALLFYPRLNEVDADQHELTEEKSAESMSAQEPNLSEAISHEWSKSASKPNDKLSSKPSHKLDHKLDHKSQSKPIIDKAEESRSSQDFDFSRDFDLSKSSSRGSSNQAITRQKSIPEFYINRGKPLSFYSPIVEKIPGEQLSASQSSTVASRPVVIFTEGNKLEFNSPDYPLEIIQCE